MLQGKVGVAQLIKISHTLPIFTGILLPSFCMMRSSEAVLDENAHMFLDWFTSKARLEASLYNSIVLVKTEPRWTWPFFNKQYKYFPFHLRALASCSKLTAHICEEVKSSPPSMTTCKRFLSENKMRAPFSQLTASSSSSGETDRMETVAASCDWS